MPLKLCHLGWGENDALKWRKVDDKICFWGLLRFGSWFGLGEGRLNTPLTQHGSFLETCLDIIGHMKLLWRLLRRLPTLLWYGQDGDLSVLDRDLDLPLVYFGLDIPGHNTAGEIVTEIEAAAF